MDRELCQTPTETALSPPGKSRHYKLVDCFRLICSFLVVLIHMGFGNSAAIIPCLSGQAVPFFFLVSGFFFEKSFRARGHAFRFARSYALSIAAVYAFWMLLWMPYIVHDAVTIHAGKSLLYILAVVLRRVLLAGIAPYWYLLVLAEGSVVLAFIIRYNKYRLGWALCIGGFLLYCVYRMDLDAGIGSMIHRAFYTVFSWENNVIMTGFPALFLGMIISRHEAAVSAWKLPLIVLTYLVITLTAFIVYPHNNAIYGLPVGFLQGMLLFIISVIPASHLKRIPESVCRVFRDLSSVVFLSHTFFLTVLGTVLHIWGTALRLSITVACSALLLLLIRGLRWRPLQWLFMLKTDKGRSSPQAQNSR